MGLTEKWKVGFKSSHKNANQKFCFSLTLGQYLFFCIYVGTNTKLLYFSIKHILLCSCDVKSSKACISLSRLVLCLTLPIEVLA